VARPWQHAERGRSQQREHPAGRDGTCHHATLVVRRLTRFSSISLSRTLSSSI
jgi:hypothetical protein